MRLNLATLRKLSKYATLTTHELTPDVARDLLSILGFTVNDDTLKEVLEVLLKEDEDDLVTWISDPDRQERLLQKVKPIEKKLTIECPECNFLGMYNVKTVAAIDPHVLCVECGVVIPLSED